MKRYILSSEELAKLKLIELEIFKETLRVIRRMNLNYFCVGGTALGSIKYGGFIPWDDDIDIAMPRPDFEKFKKYGQQFFDKNYFVQSIDSDPNFCLGLIKIRDLNTEFVEIATSKLKIVNGVFIDIFPVDGLREEKFNPSLCYKLRQSKISSKLVTLDFKQKRTIKHFISSIVSNVLYLFKSPNYLCKMNEKELASYSFDKSDHVYCRCLSFKKSIIGNYSNGLFENIDVVLPEKAEEYMSLCFGNYKQDPPDNLKISHHYVLKVKL